MHIVPTLTFLMGKKIKHKFQVDKAEIKYRFINNEKQIFKFLLIIKTCFIIYVI